MPITVFCLLYLLQEKLVQQGVIDVDQVTRTTVGLSSRSSQDHNTSHNATNKTQILDLPVLIVESAHPYRNNTSEYTTVQVQLTGAYSCLTQQCDEDCVSVLHVGSRCCFVLH